MLSDLARAGHPNQRVAERIDVALSTLRGWKAGSEPAYVDGANLLELWCSVTGRTVAERPMQTD